MTTNLPYKISQRKVNGWTNYETWAVNLWLDNDVQQYQKMQKVAQTDLAFFEGDREAAAFSFMTWLQKEIEDKAPTHLKGVYQDLLNGALSTINYFEIAANWMADIELPEQEAELAEQAEPVSNLKPEKDRMTAVAARSKSTLTASHEVLAILRQSVIDEEGLTLPGENLQRDHYEAVNKFLELAEAKWNKSKKRHLFKRGAKEKIEALLASGQIVDEQKLFQAFYTPTAIAAELVRLAGVVEGMEVLEPSAGVGAIADAANAAGASVYCVEMNPEAAGELEAKGYEVERSDFLALDPQPTFDRVVMNPPFTNDQDIKHVQHAHRFLKEGGKLVAIMSPGFTFGGSKARTTFREFVAAHGRIVKELEQGAFAESGTDVKTVIVELRKTADTLPDQASLFTAA